MTTNANTSTTNVTTMIQDLINSGYTPEKLYNYALEELNRQNKAKAEAEAKKKAEAEAKAKAKAEKSKK